MQGSDFVEAWVFVGLEGADNGVNCVWGDVIMIGGVRIEDFIDRSINRILKWGIWCMGICVYFEEGVR